MYDSGDICIARRRWGWQYTEGDEYTEGDDCVGTRICAGGLRCVNFVCARLKLVGEACSIADECALDLACIEGQCEPFDYCSGDASSGDLCYLDSSCDDDLYCERENNATRGLCIPYLQEGQTCADRAISAANLGRCAQGLHCIEDICLPDDLEAGAACSHDRQCDSYSCNAGQCD
jgi:hypothetical protein